MGYHLFPGFESRPLRQNVKGSFDGESELPFSSACLTGLTLPCIASQGRSDKQCLALRPAIMLPSLGRGPQDGYLVVDGGGDLLAVG